MNQELEKIDMCTVCRMPLPDLTQAVIQEFGGEMHTFCCPAHLQEYIEDPEKFADFEDEEED